MKCVHGEWLNNRCPDCEQEIVARDEGSTAGADLPLQDADSQQLPAERDGDSSRRRTAPPDGSNPSPSSAPLSETASPDREAPSVQYPTAATVEELMPQQYGYVLCNCGDGPHPTNPGTSSQDTTLSREQRVETIYCLVESWLASGADSSREFAERIEALSPRLSDEEVAREMFNAENEDDCPGMRAPDARALRLSSARWKVKEVREAESRLLSRQQGEP